MKTERENMGKTINEIGDRLKQIVEIGQTRKLKIEELDDVKILAQWLLDMDLEILNSK